MTYPVKPMVGKLYGYFSDGIWTRVIIRKVLRNEDDVVADFYDIGQENVTLKFDQLSEIPTFIMNMPTYIQRYNLVGCKSLSSGIFSFSGKTRILFKLCNLAQDIRKRRVYRNLLTWEPEP